MVGCVPLVVGERVVGVVPLAVGEKVVGASKRMQSRKYQVIDFCYLFCIVFFISL